MKTHNLGIKFIVFVTAVFAGTTMSAQRGGGGAGNGGGSSSAGAAGQGRGSLPSSFNPPPAPPAKSEAKPNNSADARANAPGQAVAAEKRSPTATAALQMADSIQSINNAAFEARRQLLGDLRGNVSGSVAALKAIQANAKSLRGAAQDEFKASLKDAEASRKTLNDSLSAAEKADAQHWTENRAAVARNYTAYGEAMAKVESKSSMFSSP